MGVSRVKLANGSHRNSPAAFSKMTISLQVPERDLNDPFSTGTLTYETPFDVDEFVRLCGEEA